MTGDNLAITDRFDPQAMQAFMRRPDVYWPTRDALSPPPENVDFVTHLLHPDVWTVAAMQGQSIGGYVLFNRRTTIMAEIQVAFHPQMRGVIARAFVKAAIHTVFKEKGLLKLVAVIPDDNKAAIFGARHIGFTLQGRLTNAIVRNGRTPPLADLLLFGLSKQGIN